MNHIAAWQIKITGIVQGVGFRPFVYRLATDGGLTGWVLNSSAGVFIHAQGRPERLTEFKRRLAEEAPPLALIRRLEAEPVAVEDFDSFTIRHSDGHEPKTAMVPPDIAICADCRREVGDAGDRRYAYPFTNCTNCGPRFTIIKDIPYDRAMTTMADFPMCPACQAEYDDPRRRRFHAQPNACPVCGPRITLVDRAGRPAAQDAVTLLKAGKILAVKGLGAFHLAADARDREAVRRLRRRKQRDAKPFAVMARDADTARRYCAISPAEQELLNSPAAPIVILRERADSPLPRDIIHPGLSTLGVMLPYTPLHFLLFDDELELLIMTSANISDEPLITDNTAALAHLKDLADYFLLHDRAIYQPCDDSVMAVAPPDTPQFLRRARGFVPRGITLPRPSDPLLALGGEMKSAFALSRGGEVYLSQHWGDLNHYHNYVSFQQGLTRFQKLLDIEPELVVHDLHPQYQTTRWAQAQERPRLAVQHHHAHLAAAMADNGLTGEALGLICDGSGYGSDGHIWGGEILRGGYDGYERLGHLAEMPLPGGELAIRRPYRMALAYLQAACGERSLEIAARLLPDLSGEEAALLSQLLAAGHQPRTTSCGRLFDAAGALLGICPVSRYEGQTAIELEAAADPRARGHYSWHNYRAKEPPAMNAIPLPQERRPANEGDSRLIMDPRPMWPEMVRDIEDGCPRGVIAGKFHRTLGAMFTAALVSAREQTGLNRVVLSGGCFHNQLLLRQLLPALSAHGFAVFTHRQVPPGDGGLALGQAAVAGAVGG